MSAPHFFAGAPAEGERVVLTGDDARHAAGSRRLRPGGELTSSDGRGALVRCTVSVAGPDRVEAEVHARSVEPPPRPAVSVWLAAPKGDRLTWAVQKLTELGVDRIGLLVTDRSVRRWDGDRHDKVRHRLGSVAREAAKQAGRRFLPEIDGPASWDEALAGAPAGVTTVLWERATDGLLTLLPAAEPPTVTLLIGPEGGIPEADARAAADGGALLASLGEGILRTETAALAGATIALARYGRLGG